MRWMIGAGALFAGLAVAAGAFGAHALRAELTPERLAVFETGARYQMYHALALVAVGLLAGRSETGLLHAAAYLFAAGIVLFSGSLYALVLTDTPWLGAVAPVGGVCFLAGWGALVWAALRGAV